jgi:hypothetical protein
MLLRLNIASVTLGIKSFDSGTINNQISWIFNPIERLYQFKLARNCIPYPKHTKQKKIS